MGFGQQTKEIKTHPSFCRQWWKPESQAFHFIVQAFEHGLSSYIMNAFLKKTDYQFLWSYYRSWLASFTYPYQLGGSQRKKIRLGFGFLVLPLP